MDSRSPDPPIPADRTARGGAPRAPTVEVRGSVRTLRAGDGTVHSRVDLAAPGHLALPYTRALAAALLFAPRPARALMLGLGGGALAHFLGHHYPAIEIRAIESSAAVVEAARRHFALEPGARLSIERADAREALGRCTAPSDLVLVDLFDEDGLPGWLRERSFHDRARAAMAPGAVLAANLWVEDDDEELAVMRGMHDAFDGRLLVHWVPGYRNLVVIALPDGPPRIALAALERRAGALGERLGLDLAASVAALADANRVEGGSLVLAPNAGA